LKEDGTEARVNFLPDREKARETCKTLADLLAESDSETFDLMYKERAFFSSIFGPANFREIERAVEAYDFEKALSLLRQQSAANALLVDENDGEKHAG
jgi:hypothetical protein